MKYARGTAMLESFRNQHRPFNPDENLPLGTPLVALKKSQEFFERGLLEREGLLFGVLEEDGSFLCRAAFGYESPKRKIRVETRCTPISDLEAEGYSLYVPTGPLFAADAVETLIRARRDAGLVQGECLNYSPLGDDFLYTFMTGLPVSEYMDNHPNVGKHLQVDFSVRELLSRFEFARSRMEVDADSEKGKKVQAVMNLVQGLTELHSLKLHNSAICLGDRLVTNFTAQEPDGKRGERELRLRSLEDFAKDGDVSTISYPSAAWFRDTRKRLRARNMALHLLMARPEFSLSSYNSEHFCYLCSKGKAKSPQKRRLMLKPLMMFLPGLSWLNPFKKIFTICKTVIYLVRLGALLRSFKKGSKA